MKQIEKFQIVCRVGLAPSRGMGTAWFRFAFPVFHFPLSPPSRSADKTDYGISILAVSHSGRNLEEEKNYLKSPPRVVVS
jgi:hypothetical protein